MKQYTIDGLKEYLCHEIYAVKFEDEIEKQYFKERLDRLIDELCDISKKELNWLDERDTFVIRKLLGILDNGVFQTQESIGKILNLSVSRIGAIKKETFKKMSTLIIHHTILTKEEKNIILSDSIQKLNLPFSLFSQLHRAGINTIEDLTLLSSLSKITRKFIPIIERMNEFGFHINSESEKKDFLLESIDELDLSVKTYNCLSRAGINTIAKLISTKKSDLEKIRNMGIKCIEEVNYKLSIYGLSLLDTESKQENEAIPHEQVNQNVEQITILDKYKSLLLEKKELQQRLSELDMEIISLLEKINQNQVGEKNEQSRK